MEWLRKQYPSARFSEIQAAIGGTGSRLGVFRYGQDVLQYKPDLVFVEFATNDYNEPVEVVLENFDGIVRQTWRQDPRTDIVFVYTITQFMTADYLQGHSPRSAAAMERVAEHYGIPSVDFGPRVIEGVRSGRTVMSIGEVSTAVPKETPDRDRLVSRELAAQGKLLFSKDGVHPTLSGHELYLKSIQDWWVSSSALPGVDHRHRLGAPCFSDRKERARLVPIEKSMLVGGSWMKLPENDALQRKFGSRGGQFWLATAPGDKLAFSFRGSECLVYDLYGPDCCKVRLTVDGKRQQRAVDCFDEYCTYYRLCNLGVYNGPEGLHTVEIEIDPEQPDRTRIHKREPKVDVSDSRFDGTKFYVCKLMLVGDVIMEERK